MNNVWPETYPVFSVSLTLQKRGRHQERDATFSNGSCCHKYQRPHEIPFAWNCVPCISQPLHMERMEQVY